MKRRGFTLVELLIVIAILGALSAVMTMSYTGSTAKAKASAILSNVEACKQAASMYYLDHMQESDTLDGATTSDVLSAYLPNWADLSRTGLTITYTADDEDDTGKGRENWNITVDFDGDGEKANIAEQLAKTPGYGTYKGVGETTATNKLNDNHFKVTLWNGQIGHIPTPTGP